MSTDFTTAPPVLVKTAGELIAELQKYPADAALRMLCETRSVSSDQHTGVAVLGFHPGKFAHQLPAVYIDIEGDATPYWDENGEWT